MKPWETSWGGLLYFITVNYVTIVVTCSKLTHSTRGCKSIYIASYCTACIKVVKHVKVRNNCHSNVRQLYTFCTGFYIKKIWAIKLWVYDIKNFIFMAPQLHKVFCYCTEKRLWESRGLHYSELEGRIPVLHYYYSFLISLTMLDISAVYSHTTKDYWSSFISS